MSLTYPTILLYLYHMLSQAPIPSPRSTNAECWAEKRPNITVGRRQARDDLFIICCVHSTILFATIWQTWQVGRRQQHRPAAEQQARNRFGWASSVKGQLCSIVIIFIPYTCKLRFHIVCIPRSQAFVFCLNLPVLEYLELQYLILFVKQIISSSVEKSTIPPTLQLVYRQ